MSFIANILTDFSKAEPVYEKSAYKIPESTLPAEIETIVIGGGIGGLSAALELASHGHPVLVLEAKNIGDGPSGRSNGQLWPGFTASFGNLVNAHGNNKAISAMMMVHESLVTIHKRAAMDPANCDFKPGVLLAAKTGPQAEWIRQEYAAMAGAGFKWASYVNAECIAKNYVNSNGYYLNGMVFKGDKDGEQYGHLNPQKFIKAVARLAHEAGAHIIENNPVNAVRQLDDGRYSLSTPQGEVIAKNVIMATGANTIRPRGVGYDLLPNTHVPVQTVILATGPIPEKLAHEMVPGDAGFFDASQAAMNYGRLVEEPGKPGYYRLMLGGADALGQAQTAFDIRAIEKEMHTMWPQLKHERVKIEKIWGGNCDLTTSGMPYIIEPREGFYAIGGFSGQGMVNTTLYGGAVAEKIMGQGEKFEALKLLNPEFYPSKSGGIEWLNGMIAWAKAAQVLIPIAIKAKREERAARRDWQNRAPAMTRYDHSPEP